jgi:pyridoxal phosphate enzyme (YggS family)
MKAQSEYLDSATISQNYEQLISRSEIQSFLEAGGKLHLATDGRQLRQIQQLYDLGHRHFSEKFVQETIAKWPLTLRQGVYLNGYGNLQRNKARVACTQFSAIESVGTINLINKLQSIQDSGQNVPPVFIQVNIGSESQKSGFPVEDAELGLETAQTAGLQVRGLMCIPPKGADPRISYRKLRHIADKHSLQDCSMGMSDDFEIAIGEGATLLRIGRAIFGEKPGI